MSKRRQIGQDYTRRAFLSTAIATPAIMATVPRLATAAAAPITVVSPDRNIEFQLLDRAPLTYKVTYRNRNVIAPSRVGILLNGIDLGDDFEVAKIERYRVREKYATRGAHSLAVNNCNGARVFLVHNKTKTSYTIQVRAFNDGVAFRIQVPGDGERIPDEATVFRLPAGSTVWYHDFEGHYEGIHTKRPIAEVKEGEWAAPPLTFKLPGGFGYASITEAALLNYAGLGLRADGRGGFRAVLGHEHPASYPFRLRYGEDEGKRLSQPAAIDGPISTPWRVLIIGGNLNTLVNSDIISNVSPTPDPMLFPKGIHTEWLRPGRAVWKFLDGGANTLENMKEFSRLAGELGFEHNVVEGFWQKWTENEMRELVEYSRQFNVGIWFWKHSRDLRTPESRQKFFKLCQDVGVIGAKIDFFDHEAKEIIDLYQEQLREAAKHKIMVNFHGANKPAGEARQWPNEMTREGVYGLEHRRIEAWATHNTTIPFTRMLAGHADYTPLIFGERRRETSWAHQIASAAFFNSPVLIFGGHPQSILDNPAVEMIKSIPSLWDETVALPICEIGEIAGFARRNGSRWFVPIMNGPEARAVTIPLSFLVRGRYKALLVRDELDNPAAVRLENVLVTRRDELEIEMRPGGGFIGKFDVR